MHKLILYFFIDLVEVGPYVTMWGEGMEENMYFSLIFVLSYVTFEIYSCETWQLRLYVLSTFLSACFCFFKLNVFSYVSLITSEIIIA